MGPLVALRRVPALLAVPAAALLGAALFGYENDNVPRTVRDGPHRVVNRLALDTFWRDASQDPVLSRYDRGRNRKLTGDSVVAGAMLKPTYGDFTGTWEEWVAEGGYLADEPELYASFRHFYDPLALNAEVATSEARVLHPEIGTRQNPAAHGVPYLTDHLNVLTAIWSRTVGGTFNPQIHAKEWALEGPANNGWGDNPYCWNKGLEVPRAGVRGDGAREAASLREGLAVARRDDAPPRRHDLAAAREERLAPGRLDVPLARSRTTSASSAPTRTRPSRATD